MIRPELILDLNHELIVDNFAGGGGASSGIEEALGRHVDHAINHDPIALGMHRINHPQTVHHCQNVFDIDPVKLTGGRQVGLCWNSPDCRHHSKAKGGKPLEKKIRGLAFVMFRWARIRTRVMMMENVEEIQSWGPLCEDHDHGCRGNRKRKCTHKKCHYGRPIPEHKGRTWRAFLGVLGSGIDPDHPDIPEMMEVLNNHPTITPFTKEELVRGFGYDHDCREWRASNYGAHTIRKRLFAVFRCDGRPIVWPEPTHVKPSELSESKAGTNKGRKTWGMIADCIDWSLPCHSIFLTPTQARKVRCKRPLKRNTLRRIAAGIDRYVLRAKKPFIVNLTHQGSERIEPVTEPIKTLTAAHRGEKAVVDASVAPFIGDANRPQRNQASGADESLRTQCAGVKGGHFQLVSGMLSRQFGQSVGQEVTEPAPTVMPDGQGKTALISANLVEYHSPKRPGDERNKPVNDPMPVQSTEPRFGLVATHLTKFNTGSIGSGMDESAPTIVAGHHSPDTHGGAASTLGVVAAHLIKMRGDPESHPNPPITDPMHSATASGLHHGVSACYLAQHNGGNNTNPGHPATEPTTSITTKGCQQQIVTANIAAYYGSEEDGQAVEESLRSITTKPRFGLAEARAVAPGLTEEQLKGALRVARFLRQFGIKFDGPFAMVGEYVMWDIGMRMLTPRELYRAQGFHTGYVIDKAWLVHPKTGEIIEKNLTKEQQIYLCGNSVSAPCARALVAANVPELCVWNKAERRRFERRCRNIPKMQEFAA